MHHRIQNERKLAKFHKKMFSYVLQCINILSFYDDVIPESVQKAHKAD